MVTRRRTPGSSNMLRRRPGRSVRCALVSTGAANVSASALFEADFIPDSATASHDGKWLAYVSARSGFPGYLQTVTRADELYLWNLGLHPDVQEQGFGAGVTAS